MTRQVQILAVLTVLILLQIVPVHAAPPADASREAVIDQMMPYAGPHVPGVDVSTLHGKVMCGYQGWFAAEGDDSNLGWRHYAGRGGLQPGSCTFDLWPDVSELDADERYPTAFEHADGSSAELFSPYNKKTVLRHFEWMAEYGIDGVFLQRFGASLRSAQNLNHRNVVTENVREGAMFDEIDEGTAIFKCTNDPPVGASPFVTYEGLRSDHYLRLTGRIGRMLRGEVEASEDLP